MPIKLGSICEKNPALSNPIRTLRQKAARTAAQTNRGLDQPATTPSLNSNAGCLKVVDTFRIAPHPSANRGVLRSLENMRDASFSRSSFDNVTKPARPSLTAAKRNDGVQKETASPWRSLYWWGFRTKDGRVGGLKTVIELLRIHVLVCTARILVLLGNAADKVDRLCLAKATEMADEVTIRLEARDETRRRAGGELTRD
jgi:hypothetical protein